MRLFRLLTPANAHPETSESDNYPDKLVSPGYNLTNAIARGNLRLRRVTLPRLGKAFSGVAPRPGSRKAGTDAGRSITTVCKIDLDSIRRLDG